MVQVPSSLRLLPLPLAKLAGGEAEMGLHGPAEVGGVGEADLLGYGFQVALGVVQQFFGPLHA